MRNLIYSIILVLFLSVAVSASSNKVCHQDYRDVVKIVKNMGFTVTATVGKRHNHRSKHYLGRAVDVRTKDKTDFHVDTLIYIMRELGYVVLDERRRPNGQRVWGGPHIHIHVPFCR